MQGIIDQRGIDLFLTPKEIDALELKMLEGTIIVVNNRGERKETKPMKISIVSKEEIMGERRLSGGNYDYVREGDSVDIHIPQEHYLRFNEGIHSGYAPNGFSLGWGTLMVYPSHQIK